MKKLITAMLLCVCLVFALTACVDTPEPDKLDKPTNLTFMDGILSWGEVDGAESYRVKILGNAINKTENVESPHFDMDGFANGQYVFSVQAVSGGDRQDSDWSDHLTEDYEAQSDQTKTVLSAPTNLSVTDGMLNFKDVANCEQYQIEVGEDLYLSDINSYDLSFLPSGEYTVRVRAMGDNDMFLSSSFSAPINFTIE